MKESELQRKIILKLERYGWFVTKIIQCTKNGIPDLLIIKEGRYIFIEVKKEKGKLSKLQEYRIDELKKYGVEILIVNNIANIDSLCGKP